MDFTSKNDYNQVRLRGIMKKFLLPLIIVVFCLAGCTTSRSLISDSADVGKYKYAAIENIMDYGGSISLLDCEIRVYDALAHSGLEMRGEKELDDMTMEEKSQTLLVKFQLQANAFGAIVVINFIDYLTFRPIASCRGEFALGFTTSQQTDGALKNLGR